MATPTKSALVLFAHGARETGWAEPLKAVRDRVAAARADLSVELAFLELMSPRLAECVDSLVQRGHGHIVIAPLFLAMGGHLRQDLPRLLDEIRGRHGGLEISMLPPIGETPALLDAIAAWLVNAAPR